MSTFEKVIPFIFFGVMAIGIIAIIIQTVRNKKVENTWR